MLIPNPNAKIGVHNALSGPIRVNVRGPTFSKNVDWLVTSDATPPVSTYAHQHATPGRRKVVVGIHGSWLNVKNHVIQTVGQQHQQYHQQHRQQLIVPTTASPHARIGIMTKHGICALTPGSQKYAQQSVMTVAAIQLLPPHNPHQMVAVITFALMFSDSLRSLMSPLNGATVLIG